MSDTLSGPGCSSSIGLFMELGPCQIRDANGTKFNPHAWNSKANLFFVDQPVGVGFSYAEYGESVGRPFISFAARQRGMC